MAQATSRRVRKREKTLWQVREGFADEKNRSTGLIDWFQDLKAKNAAFLQKMNERTEAQAGQQKGIVREKRLAAEAAYKNVVKLVNAAAIMEIPADLDYSAAIDLLKTSAGLFLPGKKIIWVGFPIIRIAAVSGNLRTFAAQIETTMKTMTRTLLMLAALMLCGCIPASSASPDEYIALNGMRTSHPGRGIYIKRSAEGRLQGKNGKPAYVA